MVALASLLPPNPARYPIPGLRKEQEPRGRRVHPNEDNPMMVTVRLPQCLGFRFFNSSICANASAECRRAFYLKHRPIGLHLCDTGRRARGRFHYSPRRRLRRLRQMAQLKRATICAGNECMTYPPMKSAFQFAFVSARLREREKNGFVHRTAFLAPQFPPDAPMVASSTPGSA